MIIKVLNFDKLKQLSKDKTFKITLIIILVIIIFLYFKAFFTLGTYFNDTFLKKEIINEETHYLGKNKYGDIHIIVKGKLNEFDESKTEVIYNLPNNNNQSFTVFYNHKEKWHLGFMEIKDDKENTLFEGRYYKGSLFLNDKNNEPLMDEYIQSLTGNAEKVTYDSDYKVSFKNIAEFALLEKDTLRGNADMMLAGIIILSIFIIDIKSPLFFFTLSHFLYVKDPEPSELYIVMQRISWVIYPIIALTMLILAI